MKSENQKSVNERPTPESVNQAGENIPIRKPSKRKRLIIQGIIGLLALVVILIGWRMYIVHSYAKKLTAYQKSDTLVGYRSDFKSLIQDKDGLLISLMQCNAKANELWTIYYTDANQMPVTAPELILKKLGALHDEKPYVLKNLPKPHWIFIDKIIPSASATKARYDKVTKDVTALTDTQTALVANKANLYCYNNLFQSSTHYGYLSTLWVHNFATGPNIESARLEDVDQQLKNLQGDLQYMQPVTPPAELKATQASYLAWLAQVQKDLENLQTFKQGGASSSALAPRFEKDGYALDSDVLSKAKAATGIYKVDTTQILNSIDALQYPSDK